MFVDANFEAHGLLWERMPRHALLVHEVRPGIDKTPWSAARGLSWLVPALLSWRVIGVLAAIVAAFALDSATGRFVFSRLPA